MESNVTEKKLFTLLRQSNRHHVSLYMPTHQNGTEIRQDITRFKNCLKKTEHSRIGGPAAALFRY